MAGRFVGRMDLTQARFRGLPARPAEKQTLFRATTSQEWQGENTAWCPTETQTSSTRAVRGPTNSGRAMQKASQGDERMNINTKTSQGDERATT